MNTGHLYQTLLHTHIQYRMTTILRPEPYSIQIDDEIHVIPVINTAYPDQTFVIDTIPNDDHHTHAIYPYSVQDDDEIPMIALIKSKPLLLYPLPVPLQDTVRIFVAPPIAVYRKLTKL